MSNDIWQWQPITDAARAVGECLLYIPKWRRVVVGHWAMGGGEDQPRFGPAWFYWFGGRFNEVTDPPSHWMPLPEAAKWIPHLPPADGK